MFLNCNSKCVGFEADSNYALMTVNVRTALEFFVIFSEQGKKFLATKNHRVSCFCSRFVSFDRILFLSNVLIWQLIELNKKH